MRAILLATAAAISLNSAAWANFRQRSGLLNWAVDFADQTVLFKPQIDWQPNSAATNQCSSGHCQVSSF
jgi:hypothetical protein